MEPGIYEHFKGGLYQLIGVGKHTETLEDVVIYRAVYGDREFWVRPAKEWNELVEGIDGELVTRFTWIRAS